MGNWLYHRIFRGVGIVLTAGVITLLILAIQLLMR